MREQMIATMNAIDALDLMQSNPAVDYRIERLVDAVPGGAVTFQAEAKRTEDPSSPPIETAEISVSRMYVTFKFVGTPVYMTLPAMALITIGWVE